MRKGRFPSFRAQRTIKSLAWKVSLPKREHSILKTLPSHWTTTFGPLLLLCVCYNCRPSFRVLSFLFVCSPPALIRLPFELPSQRNPPITNVFLGPRPHLQLREPSPISCTPLLPLRTLRADVGLWRRRRPRAESRPGRSRGPLGGLPKSLPQDLPHPWTALAASTHVGVQAPAVAAAAAAAPPAAAQPRNRRVPLAGRNHEPGRRQRCAVLPLGGGAPAAVPAAVHGAGSWPAAQQRVAPASGGDGGGGTGTAGPLWGPGERGAATRAPASRSLFPWGCAGNLGPAWTPVPSSCAYANSFNFPLVLVPGSLPLPNTPTHALKAWLLRCSTKSKTAPATPLTPCFWSPRGKVSLEG